jgi:hypothetical protein
MRQRSRPGRLRGVPIRVHRVVLQLCGDDPPGLNGGQESVPISVGLVGIGNRKLRDRRQQGYK